MPEASSEGKEPPSEEANGAGVPESKTIPDGIAPLFFSGPSQKIFECVVDSDLTPEHPHKLVPKEKIVEDFKMRAAVCDFHPVKQQVMKYPGEELLLVYDYDFKYGENFYICLTEEAKELVLNPPVVEGEGAAGEGTLEEEELEIPQTPEPKEWECLGSDLEIKEGFVHPGRPLLKFTVSRKRRHFGSPCVFSDHNASTHPESCAEVASVEEATATLHRIEMDIAIQAVTEKAEGSSQTTWVKPCNAAVQYAARTLPADHSEGDEAATSQELADFLSRAVPRLELALQQNQILDMFVDDYRTLSDSDVITGNKSDSNLKEYQSFTDLKFSKDKSILWIDWHPSIKGLVAVSCGENYSFDVRVDVSSRLLLSPSLVILWSFIDPIHPQLFLAAPDDVLCFQFNPSNPYIVAGGCRNGQVVLWDIESYQHLLQLNKGGPDPTEIRGTAANMAVFNTDAKLDHAPIVQYCATSSIEHGHSRPVCDLQWLPDHIKLCQKTGALLYNPSQISSQLITAGIDGCVMLWDTRPPIKKSLSDANRKKLPVDSEKPFSYLDLTWKPLLRIPLPRSEFPGNFSATRVSIREKQKERQKAQAVSEEPKTHGIGDGTHIEGACTKFFVGTEDGELVYCDWMPTKDSESGKPVPSRPEYYFNGHCGPVSCVERSPFFREVLLTVGGWTFALWKEGTGGDALIKSCSSSIRLTGGAWSLTRPGVFFITKQNGNVEVWDLMDRSHEPSLAQNISTMSITSIQSWQLTAKQQMVAVGDSGGTLHILEVPWSMSQASNTEYAIIEGFFEREEQRLETTTRRMAERAAQKKAHDAAKADQDKEEKADVAVPNWEDRAKKGYDEYLSMEHALLTQLGLVELPPED